MTDNKKFITILTVYIDKHVEVCLKLLQLICCVMRAKINCSCQNFSKFMLIRDNCCIVYIHKF